jgi:pyruvate kinase
MLKTKIICTIGPASESSEVQRKLIDSGMNVARLNFSHGSHAEHLEKIRTVRGLSKMVPMPSCCPRKPHPAFIRWNRFNL